MFAFKFLNIDIDFLCHNQGCSANKRGVGTHPKKLAILKHFRTHINAQHEKSVGRPFPSVPTLNTPGRNTHHQPLHSCFSEVSNYIALTSTITSNITVFSKSRTNALYRFLKIEFYNSTSSICSM